VAHKIRIVDRPHVNANGKPSATKRDYFVRDKTRSGTKVYGPFTSKKDAENAAAECREKVFIDHLATHPNDAHFRAKHKIGEARD
jgi:hypothetical protein